ncbi:AAA family ATPase [Fictibacillus sp. KIGAM418]|uniref:AAA family ATPase n=1 Tax=Fictibacillus marinisediminis TaxID=2878389 RepID=A0A9X1X7U9_9BACL|nr:AAA family ATPase [Fictibacillus marinisediminis]MCK6255468.1 AAA family ATPase [Fictibacillus marinisediminis]
MINHKTWDVFLLGTLAEDEYVEQETGRRKGIFINSQNVIQFLIKVISQEPDNFPNERLFTGYATDLEPYGFVDDLTKMDYQREENFVNFISDFVLVFSPAKKMTTSQNEVYHAKDLQLKRKVDSHLDNDTLVPLPVFSQQKHGYDYEEFIQRLLSKRYVGKVDKLSIEQNDTPQYILWKDDNGSYKVVGDFDNHSYAHGGFCFTYADQLRLTSLTDDWIDESYEVNDSIIFININMFDSLEDLLNLDNAEILEPITIASEEVAAAVADPPVQKVSDLTMNTLNTSILPVDHQPIVITDETEDEEHKFIEQFILVTRDNGLQYEEKDLINFHTAMKTSNLVILQGMSGTGKSRLVSSYAKALQIHNDEQLTIIPVRPAWSDDADLIGYVDSMHMVYRPGDSGLVDTLINASKERNKLFIIGFDEMNLARVEHYFSQFLSVLEMEQGRRVLKLYNESLENRLYNSAQYPSSIPIGENIMFVGTVNIDESTYHFSDKVLDRSNVISLNVLPYDQLREIKEERKRNDSYDKISIQAFSGFKNNSQVLQLTSEETDLLWELHTEFQKITVNMGIGPRVVRQIDMYLKNLPHSLYLNRRQAFDLQLVQRILTKVRGPEEFLKNLIGTYNIETDELSESLLSDILLKNNNVSDFEKTFKILKHKAKELKVNGYTF